MARRRVPRSGIPDTPGPPRRARIGSSAFATPRWSLAPGGANVNPAPSPGGTRVRVQHVVPHFWHSRVSAQLAPRSTVARLVVQRRCDPGGARQLCTHGHRLLATTNAHRHDRGPGARSDEHGPVVRKVKTESPSFRVPSGKRTSARPWRSTDRVPGGRHRFYPRYRGAPETLPAGPARIRTGRS